MGDRALLRREVHDECRRGLGGHPVGEAEYRVVRVHTRVRDGRDGVDEHVVGLALEGEAVHQPDDAGLRGGVPSGVPPPEEAGPRGGEHDPSVTAILHDPVARLRHPERALQVHVEHLVHVLFVVRVVGVVALDPRVGDHDVQPAELVERLCDHRVGRGPLRDRIAIRHRATSEGGDLVDDCTCRIGAAVSVDRPAEVVDDDRRAARGEREGVRAAEPVAGTGHDRDSAVERDPVRHVLHIVAEAGRDGPPTGAGNIVIVEVQPAVLRRADGRVAPVATTAGRS